LFQTTIKTNYLKQQVNKRMPLLNYSNIDALNNPYYWKKQPITRVIPIEQNEADRVRSDARVREIHIQSPRYSPSCESSEQTPEPTESIIPLEEFLEFSGKRIVQIIPDGNCLFRSISHGIYKTQSNYAYFRDLAVKWMKENKDTLIDGAVPFKDTVFLKDNQNSFEDYLVDMSCDGEWGDFSCILALSRCLGIKFKVVFVQNDIVLNVVDVIPPEGAKKTLWLLYDEPRRHYDLIVDTDSSLY